MATEAQFVDAAAFDSAVQAVRSDADNTNWLIVGHADGAPEVLELQSSGADVEDVGPNLDNGQVQYVLARFEEAIDLSQTIKFVYIHWLGADVGFAVRGRYGVVEGSVAKQLAPYHLSIKTSTLDEISPEAINAEIGRQSGQISNVRETVETATGVPAGMPHGITAGKKIQPSVSLDGAAVGVADNIEDALAEVRNVESGINCVAVHYPDNNIKKGLEVLHIGSTGVAGLEPFFTDDCVVYAVLSVIDIVDEIPTVKFVQVKWVGDRVKPMAKAKIATQSGEISRILGTTHVSIMASLKREVTENAIMDKVMSASGSKKMTLA